MSSGKEALGRVRTGFGQARVGCSGFFFSLLTSFPSLPTTLSPEPQAERERRQARVTSFHVDPSLFEGTDRPGTSTMICSSGV